MNKEHMKTPEDEEFERIEAESGWRKRQVQAVIEDDDDIQDYKKPWVGLTPTDWFEALKDIDPETKRLPQGFSLFASAIEAKLRSKNT